jgi:hypothetical protein
VPGKRQLNIHTGMLQLQAGGRRETPSIHPSIHSSIYRGCSHAKDEMQKRKQQRAPKTTTGRVFSSNYTTPGLFFAATFRNNTVQQQRPHPGQVAAAGPATVELQRVPAFCRTINNK